MPSNKRYLGPSWKIKNSYSTNDIDDDWEELNFEDTYKPPTTEHKLQNTKLEKTIKEFYELNDRIYIPLDDLQDIMYNNNSDYNIQNHIVLAGEYRDEYNAYLLDERPILNI